MNYILVFKAGTSNTANKVLAIRLLAEFIIPHASCIIYEGKIIGNCQPR